MSERNDYPSGVPCWVDVLTPDTDAAMRFYGGLFGWEFVGPGATPGGAAYHVARLRGRDVAGLGQLSERSMPSAWTTYIAVKSVNEATAAAVDAGAEVIIAPSDAPPAGRLAVLADPMGAAFGLWEAGARRGAQLVNEPSAWAMSALQTAELERAITFYSELFGWRPEPFDAGGVQAALMRLPGYVGGEPQQPVPRDVVAAVMPLASPEQQPAWSLDFWIDDAERAAASAAELGGSVLVGPHPAGGFRRVVLADPAGAAFSVSQLLLQG